MFDNTTPMPGENFENEPSAERARKEAEAIANGENFNPNLTAEAAEGFSNLAAEIPFAGDAAPITEAVAEAPIAETTSETGISSSDETMSNQSKMRIADNPISEQFNDKVEAGSTPNLNDIEQNVNQNYATDAIESIAANAGTQAGIAEAALSANERSDNEARNSDNLIDVSEAATISSITASSLSSELTDKVRSGDEEATAKIATVEERANQAVELAEAAEAAAAGNGADTTEAMIANSVAAQARQKAEEAVTQLNEARADYEMMGTEEKEQTKVAAELAEQEGISLDEAKDRVEEAEKEAEKESDENQPPVEQLDPGMLG